MDMSCHAHENNLYFILFYSILFISGCTLNRFASGSVQLHSDQFTGVMSSGLESKHISLKALNIMMLTLIRHCINITFPLGAYL